MRFLTDPIDWWFTPFADHAEMRIALAAAALTACTAAIVGTWVVLRSLSFFGEALTHGVLPGVAIATTLGGSPVVGALAAAAAMVIGVGAMRAWSPLPNDVSIGVLLVGALALTVVVVAGDDGGAGGEAGDDHAHAEELEELLFGSITSVDGADIVRQAILAGIAIFAVLVLYRALVVTTFDEQVAGTLGIRPALVHVALLSVLAITIVVGFEAVGSLLVVAFLVAPPATAALITRHVPSMMVAATAIGVSCATVGLLVSYHHDSEPGPVMALTTVAVFLVALVTTTLRAATKRRPTPA